MRLPYTSCCTRQNKIPLHTLCAVDQLEASQQIIPAAGRPCSAEFELGLCLMSKVSAQTSREIIYTPARDPDVHCNRHHRITLLNAAQQKESLLRIQLLPKKKCARVKVIDGITT